MKLLKSFVLAALILSSFQASAGEFSKIDLAVREEISLFFDTDYDSVKELVFAEKKEGCLLTIKAFVETTSQYGQKFYYAWSCVNKVAGNYTSDYVVEVYAYQEVTE